MKLLSKIREQDAFGTLIALNFNKKGSSHKTLAGGVLTILGKTLILVYSLQLLVQMFTYSNDDTSAEGLVEDEETLGDVYFNQTGFMPRV
jgi:hypothetical protein